MNSLLLGASCHQTAVPVSLHFSHQGPPSVTTTPSAETLDQTWPTQQQMSPRQPTQVHKDLISFLNFNCGYFTGALVETAGVKIKSPFAMHRM